MTAAQPAPATLDRDAYEAAQQALMLAGSILAEHDLDAFLTTTAAAEAECPIVNPSLFLAGADALRSVRKVAEAGRALVAAHREAIAAAAKGRERWERMGGAR